MRRNAQLDCLALCVLVAWSASGCAPDSTRRLERVSVSPSTATIDSGETQQFAATGHYSDGTTSTLSSGVTWSSTRPAVAAVDASGLATGAGAATATTDIRATYEGRSGTATLSVVYALESIAIDGPPSPLPVGYDARLGVTATYSGSVTVPVTSGVTWSSADEAVATVDAAGRARGVKAGTSTITALYQGKTATFSLTVNSASLVSIAVDPPTATLVAGRSVQLRVLGDFSDSVTRPLETGITWSDDGSGHAEVDADGLVTSAVPTSPGDTVLTATVGTRFVDATITVSRAVVESISVRASAPVPYRLPKGLSLQFTADATLSDGTTEPLTGTGWSVTPPDGSVATVDATGLVVGAGTGTATITYVDGPSSVSGSASLTVTAPTIAWLRVTPAVAAKPVGLTQQYSATAFLSDGSSADVTSSVAWSCPGASPGASVSTSGLASALRLGTATIRATDTTSGVTADATLIVLTRLAYPTDTPHLDAVGTGSSAYEVTGLIAGQTYSVSLVGASDNVDLYVYDDAAFELASCSSSNAGSSAETCDVVAPASGMSGVLYVLVDGSNTVSGATFTLDVSPLGSFAPVVVPGDVPYAGAVDTGTRTFAVIGLTPGTQYAFSLSRMSDDVDLVVYQDAAMTTVLCGSSNEGIAREKCTATAPAAGVLYVVADGGSTIGGSGFTLDVALAGPAGTEFTILRKATDLPHAEPTASTPSYYAVTGLASGTQYAVKISDMTADVDLAVYADLAMTTLLCSSEHSGTITDWCGATPGPSGTLYVLASPYLGAAFTLDVY